MADRGDGGRGEQIDIGDVMKQLTKLQTSPSKSIDVGTIIGLGYNLFFEDEDTIATAHSLMPCHKRFFISRAHPVRVVVRSWWSEENIILVFSLVEKMKKPSSSIQKIFEKLASFIRMKFSESTNRMLNMSTFRPRTMAPRTMRSYLTPCSRRYCILESCGL